MFPVRCFSCGKDIGGMRKYYKREVAKLKIGRGEITERVMYLTSENQDKTPEAEVMDTLGFENCCRRHMMTHVEV